jgi:hypothetical protein
LKGSGGYLEVNGARFKILSWEVKPQDLEPNNTGLLATNIKGFGDFEMDIHYDPPKNFQEVIDGERVV